MKKSLIFRDLSAYDTLMEATGTQQANNVVELPRRPGRPKGSKNRRTAEIEKAQLQAAGPAASENATQASSAVPTFTPTERERELVQKFRKRLRAKTPAPRFKVDHEPGKTLHVEPDHPDRFIRAAAFLTAFGAADYAFADWLLGQLINAGCQVTLSTPLEARDLNGAAAAMAGIDPHNETEAMLAAQMVAVHAAAMGALRRLKGAETIPQQDSNGNLATKLLRTYAAQVEALQRLRGKGQQTVRVEHVTVNAGGQAIVGNVTGGTGGKAKSEEQPDAKQLAHAPGETLPSDIEAHAEAVPVSGG